MPGFDIVCPRSFANDVREFLSTEVIEGSPETYETLRIEAGTPLFGPDIDENRFVMEVGNATRAVSYTKGCFLGQEPIKENLRIFLQAAARRGEALDHVLLHGPPGLGKTTLANILAAEMGVQIQHTSGPVIEKSLRESKRQLYTDLHRDVGSAVAESEQLLDRMATEPDFREGVRAWQEKRPPLF